MARAEEYEMRERLESGGGGGNRKHVRSDEHAGSAQVFPAESGTDTGTSAPCILWSGSLDRDGYGIARDGIRAHRVEWQKRYGLIPKGMCVLHTCDQPACIELSHLYLGTHRQNMADRDRKGRQARGVANGRALLDEAAVREIRRLRGRVSAKTLAEHYGVSLHTVKDVLSGKTWRHVA